MTKEKNKKNILRDGAIYLLGEILIKTLPFLLLPYLTRSLPPDEFAKYAYYYASFLILLTIVLMSQDGAISRYYFRYGKRQLPILILISIFISSFITLFLFSTLIFFDKNLTIIGLAAFTSTFIFLKLSLLQCQKLPNQYIKLNFIIMFSQCFLTVILIEYANLGGLSYFYAVIIINIFFSFKILTKTPWRSMLPVKASQFRRIFLYIISFGGPSTAHQFFLMLRNQGDRILVFFSLEASAVAIYSAGSQLALVVPVALLALNRAIVPYLFEGLKAGSVTRFDIDRGITICAIICGILAGIILILPSQLFTIILGESYSASTILVKTFSISHLLTLPYLLVVNCLFYFGKTKEIAWSSFIASIIYIALTFACIWAESIDLIPLALGISNLCLVGANYFHLRSIRF